MLNQRSRIWMQSMLAALLLAVLLVVPAHGNAPAQASIHPRVFKPVPSSTFAGQWDDELIAGDVDGDHLDDLVQLTNESAALLRIWTNTGAAQFISHTVTISTTPWDVYTGELIDLDHDQDNDLLLSIRSGPGQIWLNDGAGNFTLARTLGTAEHWTRLIARDLNGDEHLDIVLVDAEQVPAVWLNDGMLNFTQSGTLDGRLPSDPDLGPFWDQFWRTADLDGDQDLDILTERQIIDPNGPLPWEEQVYRTTVWENDGTGHFTPTARIDSTEPYLQPTDINQDGDLDLVGAISASAPDSSRMVIYFNDGNNGYASTPDQEYPGFKFDELADINGDGWPDAVWIEASPGKNQVLISFNHNGQLGAPQVATEFTATEASRLSAYDNDADGDTDLIASSWNTPLIFIDNVNGLLVKRQVVGATAYNGFLTGNFNGDAWPDKVLVSSVTLGGARTATVWLSQSAHTIFAPVVQGQSAP